MDIKITLQVIDWKDVIHPLLVRFRTVAVPRRERRDLVLSGDSGLGTRDWKKHDRSSQSQIPSP
jgi:hypothetical protein